MLIEPGFQVGHAGLQLGNLLLLVRQNAHQSLHALADRQRSSRPVVWGDTVTSRWQVEIHAAHWDVCQIDAIRSSGSPVAAP
jgi:hypothetical protein